MAVNDTLLLSQCVSNRRFSLAYLADRSPRPATSHWALCAMACACLVLGDCPGACPRVAIPTRSTRAACYWLLLPRPTNDSEDRKPKVPRAATAAWLWLTADAAMCPRVSAEQRHHHHCDIPSTSASVATTINTSSSTRSSS